MSTQTTNPDLPLTEQPTYIWRRIAPGTPSPDPTRAALIVALMTATLADNLPIMEPVDLDPATDAGYVVEGIEELRDPLVSYGQCDTVTAAILDELTPAAIAARRALADVAFIDAAQALDQPMDGNCRFHDALLIGLHDGSAFVVDFTFTQFATDAQWPLVASADDWVEQVAAASATPSPGARWLAEEGYAWGEPNKHRGCVAASAAA